MNMTLWVPQIFYDLIGRVAPGAFLLCWFATPCACLWPKLFHKAVKMLDAGLPQQAPLRFMLAIGAAYFVGSLLGGLWKACDKFSDLLAKKCPCYNKKLHARFSESALFDQRFNEARAALAKNQVNLTRDPGPELNAHMYDAIRLCYPKAGERIAKLRAEQYQAGALTMGFLLLGVAFWCVPFLPKGHHHALHGFAVATCCLAIVSYLFLRYIVARVADAHVSLWALRDLHAPET